MLWDSNSGVHSFEKTPKQWSATNWKSKYLTKKNETELKGGKEKATAEPLTRNCRR